MRRPAASRQDGYALVALIVAMTVMLILMLAAVPAWRYVMKNERELELIFRQQEIARAIKRYEQVRKAPPLSLDMLVQAKVLRRKYKNPLSPDGRWHYVRQGEAQLPGGGQRGAASPFPFSNTGPGGQEGAPGPFIGVRATSSEKGLRVINDRETYNEWIITKDQPVARIGKSPLGTFGRPQVPVFPQPQPAK